ncbi:hypothetical protein SPHINGO8AM_30463 [Sphingomonas sp. 8AM]|nr:hypothetical protein SPHINGO8AM_30463 [Sphingomonas sp. 8AM]
MLPFQSVSSPSRRPGLDPGSSFFWEAEAKSGIPDQVRDDEDWWRAGVVGSDKSKFMIADLLSFQSYRT